MWFKKMSCTKAASLKQKAFSKFSKKQITQGLSLRPNAKAIASLITMTEKK